MTDLSERCRAMTDLQLAQSAIALLGAIMQMSDAAQKNGGASCISGVASLNTLQTSLQKNGVRMAVIAAEVAERAK